MARTTLALDDDLLRRLKRKAAEESRSMQAVANDLLRQALSAPPRTKYRLKLRGWAAQLQPGVDVADRDRLFDLLEAPER